MRLRELLALSQAFAADDSSALWRSLHPDGVPFAHRLAVDQVNLSWLRVVQFARANGDRRSKFEPLYTYPGGPWERPDEAVDFGGKLGGYVVMDIAEAERWRRELEARQRKSA